MKLSHINTIRPNDCEVCVLGKMTLARNRKPDSRAKKPLKLVHNDLAGTVDPVSEDYRYCAAFTDDFSGTVFVYFLNTKSDTVAATERFLAYLPFGKVGQRRRIYISGVRIPSESIQDKA